MTLVGQHGRHRYRIIASFVDESTHVAVHSVAHNAFLQSPEAEIFVHERQHQAVVAAWPRIIAIQSSILYFFFLCHSRLHFIWIIL